MKLNKKNRFLLSALACAGATLAVPSVFAADRWWDGTAANVAGNGNSASAGGAGTWNTTLTNWDAGAVPHVAWVNASSDTAIFAGTAGIVTIAVPITAGGLTFSHTTGTYTLQTGVLTLAAGSIIKATAGGGTASLATMAAADNIFRFQNTVTTNGIANATNLTISSAISGASTAVQILGNGASTAAPVVFSGALSYGAGTTVAANAALGFSTATVTGLAAASVSVGANSTILRTGGSLNNAFLGILAPSSDPFTIVANNASSTVALDLTNFPNASLATWDNAGTATFAFNGAITPGSNGYRFGSTRVGNIINISAAGVLSGANNLTIVTGSLGQLKINNAQTFSGTTLLQASTLQLATNLGIQNSIIDTSGAGVINVTGATTPTFGGLSGSKNITGAGGLITTAYTAVTGLTLNPGAGQIPVYSGILADGAAGMTLTKTGLGTQTLAGANTFSGATAVNAGTLQLDYSTQNNSKLSDTAALVLGGGTVDLKAGTHTEIVVSTTLAANTASSVTRSSPGSILQMGAITPAAGATINFGADGIATTDTTNTNGILGTWATVGGSNWASNLTNAAGGSIVTYTGYADVNAQGPGSSIVDGIASNVRIFADGTSGTIELGTSTTTINSLLQSNATIAAAVNTAGKTLAAGAIWLPAGKANLTVGVAANDGFLTAVAAGGDLLLQNDSTSVLTINAVIADNTNSTVTKTGAGPLQLTGNNTFAGGLRLNGGTLTLGHNNALGTGPLSINGGSLAASGTVVATNSVNANVDFSILGTGVLTLGNVVLNANRIVTNANTTAPTTLGAISGVGRNLTFSGNGSTIVAGIIDTTTGALTKNGAGTLTLSGANIYSGDSTVTGGTLNITGSITGSTTTSRINVNPATGSAILNYNGDATTSSLFAVTGATVPGTASVFNMTGGAMTITPLTTTSNQNVAGGVGAYGFYNMTGGVFRNVQRFTVTGQGTASATNGTGTGVRTGVIFVGGTGFIDHTGAEWWLNYSLGQVTVADSGKIDHTGSSQPFAIFMDNTATITGGGYGVLNLAGANAQVITGAQPIRFGNSNVPGRGDGQSGFVNVAAGTLSVGANVTTFLPPAPVSINNAYFNFAGGTVKATTAVSGWIPVSNASINFNATIFGPIDNSAVAGAPANFTGGLTVDSDTFDIAIPNPLQAPAGSGVSQADLSVSGGSGYVGPPAVIFSSAGVVAGGTPAAGYALINGGSVAGIVITAPGTYTAGTVPTVTLVGGGGTGAAVTAGALNTPNAGGGLTKISDGTLTLSGPNTYSGATLVSGGTLLLNGSAATTPTTAALTVNTGGTLGFTAATASTLNLTGKPVTLGGGTVAIDIGATGISDALTVGNFTLTANSAFTFNPIGAVPNGGSYTLLSSTNPITTGGFSIAGQTIGRLVFTPTINASTITLATSLNEGVWKPEVGGNWSVGNPAATGGNWNNYKPNLGGDAALFGSAITGPAIINVDTPQSVGYLRFDNASNAYTIGSGASSNLILDNGAFAATVTVSSGSHVIAENVLLTSNVNVVPAAGTTLTVSGNLSGPGSALQLLDSGTLVLSGTDNSYSGTTTVSTGTLSLTGALNGGGAIAVIGNGVLSQGATGIISGATTLNHSSSGTSILAGSNSYTGTTTVSAGILSLTGSLSLTGGGAITVNGSGVLSQSATGVISGGLGTATALTHNSSGSSSLAGANTYPGATRVSLGTLSMSGGNLGSGSIFVGDTAGQSATLNITAGTYNFLGTGEIRAGQITAGGTGTVNQSGGTVTFTNTAGGAQLVLGGNADNATATTGIYNLSGGSVTIPALVNRGILIGSTGNTIGSFVLSGTGTLNMTTASGGNGDANLFIGRPENAGHVNITAGFTQTGGTGNIGNLSMGGSATFGPGGSQTLTLTGGSFSANGFSRLAAGDSNVSAINIGGTADVTLPAFPIARGAGATATITFDGGTLKPLAASPAYMGGLSNAFIQDGGARFDTTNGSITITQNLLTDLASTGGGLTKDGSNTLTLTGTNTYTGATTVNAGTLLVSSQGSLAAGAVAVLNTSTLGGNGTLGGSVTVDAAGNLAPGALVGTLTISGALNISAPAVGAGILTYELDTLAGPNDKIVTGTLAIGSGALGFNDFVFTNLGGLQAGTYKLITSSGLTGTLDAGNLTGTIGAFNAALQLNGNDVELVVGTAAYATWAALKGLNGSPGFEAGKGDDPDRDGRVNLDEFAFDGNPLSGINDGKIVGKVATLLSLDKVMTLTLPVRTGANFSPSAGDQVSALIDAIIYRVEGDADLGTFADSIAEITGVDATAIQTGLPALSSGWTYRTFRSPGTVLTAPKSFLRAKISE